MVRTMPDGDYDVKVVALSCDSPDRLKDGETNMWDKLADQVNADEGKWEKKKENEGRGSDSCYPDKLKDGETNMWDTLANHREGS